MQRRLPVGMAAGSVGVVLGFPIIYAGITYGVSGLVIAGLVIFAIGILFEPALRLIPKQADPRKSPAPSTARSTKGPGNH